MHFAFEKLVVYQKSFTFADPIAVFIERTVIRSSRGPSFRRTPESRDVDRMKQPCVYILASRRKGTLYVGVTSDLIQRVWQHKEKLIEGFTKRYGVQFLS